MSSLFFVIAASSAYVALLMSVEDERQPEAVLAFILLIIAIAGVAQ